MQAWSLASPSPPLIIVMFFLIVFRFRLYLAYCFPSAFSLCPNCYHVCAIFLFHIIIAIHLYLALDLASNHLPVVQVPPSVFCPLYRYLCHHAIVIHVKLLFGISCHLYSSFMHAINVLQFRAITFFFTNFKNADTWGSVSHVTED